MGFDVLVAFGNGHPYDLVAHAGPDFFMRVECKTARPVGACVSFFARDYIAKNWSIDRFEAEIAGRAAVGERAALA